MTSPFPRTAHALAGQSSLGARLTLVTSIELLAAWGSWFAFATVPVYEASEHARLEVQRASHPVDAPYAGRVTAVHLTLDAPVVEGDVLVELDADAERQELAEARARAEGLAPQIVATRNEIAAEERALAVFRQQLDATLQFAESQLNEAEIMARSGQVEAERTQRLFEASLATQSEMGRTRAEAERRKAAEDGARATIERQRREAATGEVDRRSRIASLRRDAARFDADLASDLATIQSLEHAIDRRTIRAPASGRAGEIGLVRVGSVLAQGEHIATIIAGGDLRIVASFAPAAALGRVRPGQHARMRLDGFPWTEYGAVQASVTRVATELREGLARVELAVDPTPTRVPLQHGLPGIVEVKVEEVTPATLVLRTAGRMLTQGGR
jgi:membrane fusion protein (multidrug efflux system)